MSDLKQDALTEAEALRLADEWAGQARKAAAGQLSLERMRRAANKTWPGFAGGRTSRDLRTMTLVGEEPK